MKSIFVGFGIFGDTINLSNPQISVMVLTGKFDDELLQSFYWAAHNKIPVGDEYKTDTRVIEFLNRTKERIREDINTVFRIAEEQDNIEKSMKLNVLRKELRESNKPHEMGTVSEIAQKYGISKSEVRRRKADGTLNELFDKQLTTS